MTACGFGQTIIFCYRDLTRKECNSLKCCGWKSEDKWIKYKCTRNRANKRVKNALIDYENSISRKIKIDPRFVYSCINKKGGISNGIKSLRINDGT